MKKVIAFITATMLLIGSLLLVAAPLYWILLPIVGRAKAKWKTANVVTWLALVPLFLAPTTFVIMYAFATSSTEGLASIDSSFIDKIRYLTYTSPENTGYFLGSGGLDLLTYGARMVFVLNFIYVYMLIAPFAEGHIISGVLIWTFFLFGIFVAHPWVMRQLTPFFNYAELKEAGVFDADDEKPLTWADIDAQTEERRKAIEASPSLARKIEEMEREYYDLKPKDMRIDMAPKLKDMKNYMRWQKLGAELNRIGTKVY